MKPLTMVTIMIRGFIQCFPHTNNNKAMEIVKEYTSAARNYQLDIEHNEYNMLIPFQSDGPSFHQRVCNSFKCIQVNNCIHKCALPDYFCTGKVKTIKGLKKCNWGTIREYIVDEEYTKDKEYLVIIRSESIREFLFCPQPSKRLFKKNNNEEKKYYKKDVKISKEENEDQQKQKEENGDQQKQNNHQNNEELCVNKDFWAFVLQWCKDHDVNILSLSTFDYPRFSFNFGAWESDISKNPEKLECHGHLHFYLTIDEYNIFKKLDFPCGEQNIKSFLGRFRTPKFYLKEELDAIEIHRMLANDRTYSNRIVPNSFMWVMMICSEFFLFLFCCVLSILILSFPR